MHSNPIVHLQGISKTYPKDIVALQVIDVRIAEQSIVGIVGANGSGKSTLLKIMAGSLEPNKGSMHILQMDMRKNAEQLKQHISYISQDRALDPEMTGKELLRYFSALYSLTGEAAKQRYQELVQTFALSEFVERRVHSYSGGQAQRLHLAIGLLHQPKLLLLDEPTAALDPKGKAFFWDFMQFYQEQGNTIIMVSHELDKVRQYCSSVLLMDKGHLIADASPDAIIQAYAQSVLHIKTTTKLKNTENLVRLLQQGIVAANIQIKGSVVRLAIQQDSTMQQADILSAALLVMQELNVAVIECRWEEPGLESAYFKLTGTKIMPTPGQNNKKGQRKRR